MDSVPFSEIRQQFVQDPLSLCNAVPGIWLVNKPRGPSSNFVVTRSRKRIGTKKVGHAGTLDPMAEGLLVLLAGNATRLFDDMQQFPKTYVADFCLGQRTDSGDATGSSLEGWAPTASAPQDRAAIDALLGRWRGNIEQVPPMHSALKHKGLPLYRLARKGATVERKPRLVTVYSLELTRYDGQEGTLTMQVSSGFYVRVLIDELGLALGCGAVMTRLVRTRIGPFALEDAEPFVLPPLSGANTP